MKIKNLILATLLLCGEWFFAQNTDVNWKEMTPQQRKEAVSKLSPEDRRALFRKFREDMMITELKIPKEKQEGFKKMYAEYQIKQREIKNKFQHPKDFKEISNEHAKQLLDSSFVIAQQLLDNKKFYAEKFQTLLSPQQILRMFHIEGKNREHMMERRIDANTPSQKP